MRHTEMRHMDVRQTNTRTDDRFALERQGLEVALRMIRFEARTNTIRSCTGLTEDRVRKLYRSYVARHRDAAMLVRRRGKSPQDIENVLRNAHTREQAALVAGTFATLGLLSPPETGAWQLDWRLGASLCDAYELYLHLGTERPLSFEHAWFLWQSLTSSDELLLAACDACAALTLRDRYAVRTPVCPWCGDKGDTRNGRRKRK